MQTEAATPIATPVEPKQAKSFTISLRSAVDSSYLNLCVERTANGARSYVQVISADKKSSRGMSATHSSFDEAKDAMVLRATEAVKLGWQRPASAKGFAPKPDAFASLPKPSTAAPKAPKGKK